MQPPTAAKAIRRFHSQSPLRSLKPNWFALLITVVSAALAISATSAASGDRFLIQKPTVNSSRNVIAQPDLLAMVPTVAAQFQDPVEVAGSQTGPTVSTDKLDYAPGETANINGFGFQANEAVTLRVAHTDESIEGGNGHQPWVVTTDAQGNFSSHWVVDIDDSLNTFFLLTADSASAGHAEWRFSDTTNPTTSGPIKVAVYGANVLAILNSNPAFQATAVTQAQIEAGQLAQYDVLVTRMCCAQPSPAMVTAINNFVAAGGGYVGEWWAAGAAFSSAGSPANFNYAVPNFIGLFTGSASDGGYLATGTPLTVTNPGHPVVQNLPGVFSAGGGTEYFVRAVPPYDPKLSILATYNGYGGTYPAVMVGQPSGASGGDAVLLLFDAQDNPTDPNLKQLFFNSVAFAGARPSCTLTFTGFANNNYTEENLRVYSTIDHLHLNGSNLQNHSACCSTPYIFEPIGGGAFDAISMDVVANNGNATFTASSGATVTVTSTGHVNFPSGFRGITWMRWDQPLNATSIDNLEVRGAACGASNTAPTANAQSISTQEDTAVNITLTASDPESNSLTYIVTNPAHGSLSGTAPSLSYQPDNNYNGSDSFTFHVNDGSLDSNEATVSITVNPVNDSPVLSPINNQTINELDALVLDFPILGSDPDTTDSTPDTLTYSLTAAPAGATIDPASGVISWTPTEAQGGSSDSPFAFTVRLTDSHDVFVEQSFSVTVNEVNAAPSLAAIGNQTIDEQVPFALGASASDEDLPANTLTYSLVGGPAGASIDPATGAFNWTPGEAQGPGSYTFIVKVSDNGTPLLSDQEEITINVREVNRPPVLSAIANQNAYWGNAVGFIASASDPDIPANTLSFSLIGAPGGATIDSASGAFQWTPTVGQIGSHTFTVRVTDDGTPNMHDDKTVTLTIGKRPTLLIYIGDGAEQYSDQQGLSATLADAGGGALNGLPLASKTIGFVIGTQNTSTLTNASGVAATNLILTQNPNPVYTVDSSFAGDTAYLASNDSDPFDITQEDARAYYTGACFASTSSASASSATVTLSATIKDITAETGDPATDSFAGDIRNARVTFINRDTNTVIAANVPVGLVNAADTKIGTATYNWNVNIGSADSVSYTIGIIVTNYYTRNSSDENSVVTVSKPLGTNFITGGGYLLLSNSSGLYAGGVGSKNNFGFNVKYNKNGSSLQGNINAIVRNGGRVYQIKGNAMTSLSVAGNKATYNGKANIQDITDPLNPFSIDGNGTLQVKLTDNGEPGKTDTISITIWNKNGGLWFASNWDGTRTLEQVLGGGNLVVR